MTKSPKRAKIFCLMNFKGGVGKTTSTFGFASALSRAGIPFGIADCNHLQKSSTRWLATRKQNGTTPVIHGNQLEPSMLEEAALRAGEAGLSVLLVDCPPDFGKDHEKYFLPLADLIIAPVLLSSDAIDVTKLFIEALQGHPRFSGKSRSPVAMLSILPTSNKKAEGLGALRSEIRKLALTTGVPLLQTEVPNSFAQHDRGSWPYGLMFHELGSSKSIANGYRDALIEIREALGV